MKSKKITSIIVIAIILLAVGVFVLKIAKDITYEITKKEVERRTHDETERITKEIVENDPQSAQLTQEEINKITREEVAKRTEEITREVLSKIFLGKSEKVYNVQETTWAGHTFIVGQLDDPNYKSDGTIEWLENGYIVHDYALARAKLLDINMNQKIKIKVTADMQGEIKSDNDDCITPSCIIGQKYHFAEFAFYFVDGVDIDNDIDGHKYGIALIGTRNRIAEGNARKNFKFEWFTVENAGNRIIFEDSSGRRIILDENSQTQQRLSNLNSNDEWKLRINSHVNGEGYTKLEIKEIQIVK